MPFSEKFQKTAVINFRILMLVNLIFLVLALFANFWLERWALLIIHAITGLAFLMLYGMSNLRPNYQGYPRIYLAIMAAYFYSFFWYGHIDTYDLIWLLLFPPLVAFLIEKDRELILWQGGFILGVFIFFIAAMQDVWGLVYPPMLIGAVLFSNSFISVLSWFNHRYKARFYAAQEAFQNVLEQRVEQATQTIRKLNDELEVSQRDVVMRLGEICEVRSKETGQHVQRVSEYSRRLAELINLPEDEVQLIQDASPLHDVGKVAIPDNILNKPGRYDEREYSIMKEHANIGYKLLNSSPQPLLQAAAIIARDHHEWWNGKGYPNHKAQENIHIYGRIVAIADVFDALSFERIYKPAWSDDKILALFNEQCGVQFDPRLCQLFLDHYDEFIALRKKFC
ncbi:phosphohydrolase [Thiomicrospira aerophila AL3]|uniref:Phosphohydrolase n=2 Tax=Thiomicrospira aerophila TaxID=92245 RepID=W0DP24_9GAMM|nr:phosphohydrolase [Thiomicrospira aerophila AL3]